MAAGGCIGTLAIIVPDSELNSIINEHLIGEHTNGVSVHIFLCHKIFMLTLNRFFLLTVNDPTVDWTVRHGHAIALSAILHDAVDRVMSQDLYDDVTNAAVAHATTDRVSPVTLEG